MKTPVYRKNYSLKLAFVITVIAHLFFYELFSIIYWNYKSNLSEQFVFLDYSSIEKFKPIKVNQIRKGETIKKDKKKLHKEKNPSKVPYFQTSSNTIKKIDTLIDSTNQYDSSKTFDKFLLNNPNLITLKIALKRNIDNGVITKSEAKITEERINKAMLDYYKAKYPTPPYKFGELGTGNIINIPIDDIIELFK